MKRNATCLEEFADMDYPRRKVRAMAGQTGFPGEECGKHEQARENPIPPCLNWGLIWKNYQTAP